MERGTYELQGFLSALAFLVHDHEIPLALIEGKEIICVVKKV